MNGIDIVLILVVTAAVGFTLYTGISLWRSHRRMAKMDAEFEATMLSLREQLQGAVNEFCDGVQEDIGRLVEEQAVEESKTEVKH